MLSTFDYDKLGALLRDFHHITGMRITIFDDSFREIISYPEEIAPICRYIRTDQRAAAACRECDVNACRTASRRRAPYIYQCHAGLTEAAAPVMLGGIVIAYLLFGHLFSYPTKEEGREAVLQACIPYALDTKKLAQMTDALPLTDRDYILSASHILQAVSSYLGMERMVTLRQQEVMVQIDEYISAHFTEELDAQELCDRFGVGRTSLYRFARENYGCGIAEHIRSLRIDHAKELLRDSPELSIAEIADRCGFSDYNYFITVFKRETGMSPLRFRRQ